ncbi:hypothetical protein PMAC_002802 [Pneumocystis sp. 'macacae']|nr:hypothetical protein PMAC_002802 [Pneumocystis sp. 'macacae']
MLSYLNAFRSKIMLYRTMMDLQETIEAYKRSELTQNDISLKKDHESIQKSPIFLKKVPLNSIYTKTLQNDSSIKSGLTSLNEDNFKQRTLPFNLSCTVKKNDHLNNLSKYEGISKQDLIYSKITVKEKNNRKIPENNFEVCVHEKTPSKFLNFSNRLYDSPLLQGNISMESQLSTSKNPWRNRLSGFSPPSKRKNAALESSENADSMVFVGTEASVDSVDIFSTTTKKQKILQPNFNQVNTPLVTVEKNSKDSLKFSQKKMNVIDQNDGGVGLLFSGLEKVRREREELEKELNIKNTELLQTNSQLLSIKQKTKDVKSRFFGFQKFLDGLGRDHNSLHKEIIKWSNEIKSFQTDIIKSRESLQAIIHQCEVLTHQGRLNSKVHKQLGEVKEELVKQNMYRKSLQEKHFKDATLLAEERDKVRFLEKQLISERKEKDNQYNKFLKEHEFFERLLQNFYEETQKNENTLKDMFTRWSDEIKTLEHKILHEISLNFHAESNIFDPFLKEIQEEWQKYSKESLSIYSDIKNFHSNIFSSNNKRIEELENSIKQLNIAIKEKKYDSAKKTDDFVELIKSFQLEMEQLKVHFEKFRIDFEKPFYLKDNDNNGNYLNKFQDIKEISEKLKISEKNYEQLSSENIKLQNIIEGIKQELKVSKDECDSLTNKLKNLGNSNSLFMNFSNNSELKKQYEKEIAEYERRVLKLKETEQAKFDNIIKSKDNKINKLEKEILTLKSLNNNDKNNIEDDKLFSKEKLVYMAGLEKAELIEKVAYQNNIINSLKFEITKLLNKNNFSDDINKDPQKNQIFQSSNRIIHQTPGKSSNPTKININTPIHLVSQIISPPSENEIKRIQSNSLEHLNSTNKTNFRLMKSIENSLRDEIITDNIKSLNDGLISTFTEISENFLISNQDHSLLEKFDSPLVFFDNSTDTQHKNHGSSQLVLQSSTSSEKENKGNIIDDNNISEIYQDKNIKPTSQYAPLDANTLKSIENGSSRKKNQDKQKASKKAQFEYSSNNANFWLTEQLENSTDQKSYSTRSITNTYKKKKNGSNLIRESFGDARGRETYFFSYGTNGYDIDEYSSSKSNLLLLMLLYLLINIEIVDLLAPAADRIQKINGGFLIFSIILIFFSFPPMIGREIATILIGFVYGYVGFIIVLISFIIGETLVFLSFRHFCHAQAIQFRNKYKNSYGVFVKIIEERKITMMFLISLSAIPSHFSTPLFATINSISYYSWLLVVIPCSIKHIIPVYVGILFRHNKTSIASTIVLIFSIVITLVFFTLICLRYQDIKKNIIFLNPVSEELIQNKYFDFSSSFEYEDLDLENFRN